MTPEDGAPKRDDTTIFRRALERLATGLDRAAAAIWTTRGIERVPAAAVGSGFDGAPLVSVCGSGDWLDTAFGHPAQTYAANVATDMRFPFVDAARIGGWGAALAVPLDSDFGRLGLLTVFKVGMGGFTRAEIALIETCADWLIARMENTRKWQALERLAEQSIALRDTGMTLTQSIERVMEDALKLLDADKVIFAMSDPRTDTHRTDVAVMTPRGVRFAKLRVMPPLMQAAFDQGEAFLTGEIDPSLPDMRSGMAVPIFAGGQRDLLGVLAAFSVRDGAFGAANIAAAAQLARYAGEAFNRTRTLQTMNNRLHTLSQIGPLFAELFHANEAVNLRFLQQRAADVMHAEQMVVALWDEAKSTLDFKLVIANGQTVEPDTLDAALREGNDRLIDYTARARVPLFLAGREAMKAWQARPDSERYKLPEVASWISVPLLAGDRLIGVTAVYHPTREHVYDQIDLLILSTLASYLASMLDNQRTRARLQSLVDASRELAALGTVLGAIQHRAYNTLNYIAPDLESLRLRVDSGSERIAEILGNIETRVQLTSQMLMRATHLASGGEPEMIALIDLLQSAAAAARSVFPQVHVKVVGNATLPNVQAPTVQLTEIVLNLIENACRVTPTGGEVVIDAAYQPLAERFEIRVRDEGRGIVDEVRSRLFVRPVSTRGEPSSGLGLWLSKRILLSIGGDIEIEQTRTLPPTGTTFLITLPLEIAQSPTESDLTS